jgi:hypothetical protein
LGNGLVATVGLFVIAALIGGVFSMIGNSTRSASTTTIPTPAFTPNETTPTPTETAPWYPSGYKELTSNVAYKALDKGTMDCGYSSAHSCFQAYFVTNTTCNLFVDVNFLIDGVVVDNGIDSAYVEAGERAILSFPSIKAARYSGKGTIKITDVTCY